MSLPFYQRHHQHFDRAYRHKELESTLSQYQKEEKRKSAIYTQGSTAYSKKAALAYRYGSASSQELAEAYAHESAAHIKSSSAYSQGSELMSKKAEAYHLGSELVNKKAEAYRLGYENYNQGKMIEDYSVKLSPKAKRAKKSIRSEEKENTIVDYVVPVFTGRQTHISGITDTEEERIKESAAYIARRNLFATGEGITATRKEASSSVEEHARRNLFATGEGITATRKEASSSVEEQTHKKSRKVVIREKAEQMVLKKTLSDTEEFHRKLNEDSLLHAPEFVIKPRSHTVWEKQNVRLHCTVTGWPEPRVTWYKNHVPINVHANPGKYAIESRYGMHSLDINKCDFEDTAQYRASAMNVKGELSAYASLVVKRYKGEFDESFFHAGIVTLPLSFGVTPHGYASRFEIHFVDAFEVSFGREGETMSLGCTVVIHPDIKRFHPEIQWYRNGVLISPSKWIQTHWSGERASLTLTHANKEDEGLYTLRVVMGDYYDQYSAYVFVRDADAEIAGAPGSPLDVKCLDANKDYVIISWKQPAVDGGSPILGYFIDKCEVGTTRWSQCNETPVKFARFPVTGLIEGRSYIFRVRAVNNAGISIPSRVSEPVAALDPADRARLRSHPSAPWTGQIIVTEEEPTEGIVPGPPLDLHVTEATKNYVVLSWKPPYERGHEGVMYFVEKCVAGTENWQRVNTEIPVKSPRFALFDLAEGKSYQFRVRCCNSAGIGEPSEATEVTVVGDKLDIPSPPTQLVPTRNTDTSVVLTWTEPKDAKELVGYYIEASKVGSGHWEPCNNNPVKGTRFTCHGLTIGDRYIFHARAVNAAGLSGYSQESEAIEVKAAIAPPSPPYDITVLESVHNSMVLGWKQPKTIGGAEVTGYYVNYREVIDGIPGEWKEANIKPVSERAYRVHDLKENTTYQFQVAAANLAGLGTPSPASRSFKCEEWTIAVPGPPHDLSCSQVRKDSLIVLWKPPVYIGRSPVIGFYVDMKKTNASDEHWRSVNEKAITNTFLKISGLIEGTSYVFRVRAANKAGVGKPSDPTDPVIAETRPGTKEVVAEVDDNGVISLNFECDQMTADSKFIWSKNYEPIDDDSRLAVDTKGGKSKAIFKDLSEEDLGIYSCDVTDTDGVSSSYVIDEEEMKRLLALSHEHKFPVVPLKSELAVEILEKGQVRFWLQAEKLSPNAKVNFVFNDKEIVNGEKYKMKVDHNSGMIEMFMDRLQDVDEGTYTFQLQDGKATNQSSLVLIGDVFQKLQKQAEFQRQEWFRIQGPHFIENLGWEVTSECNVLLKCKVANIKKETHIIWYKDERQIMVDEKHDFKDGVCTLLITEFSKKDAGIYEVILKDDRGKDKSVLKLVEAAFADLMTEVCKMIALSATELKIQSTEEGIRLHSFVNYYLEDLRVSWSHNDAKIKYTDRVKTGVTGEQIWLQINEPTSNDKGRYILELFDGKTGHTKKVDLSGQAFDEAFAEFQRLKAAAVAEKNRARVLGGLPDVVTIQEGKALNLTCNVWGNPAPEVSWLKNEKRLIGDDHIILKYESEKKACFTVTCVTTVDSGRYSLVVKNQYGTETSDFTVSVFIPEEGIPPMAHLEHDTKDKKKKA
ncbi:myomesin-1 isoform X1 [Rhineura floridana]|uniref:myomesin-1 isoform X1 n=1 Tax=Rhineura floridana TaxID=261503 RepID=UPI002AC87998|nr:myomesin-1 isoform X1 [Rhineura floridana]